MLELIIKDTDTGEVKHRGEYNCIFASVVADVGEAGHQAGVLNYVRNANNLSAILAVLNASEAIDDFKKNHEQTLENELGFAIPFEVLAGMLRSMSTEVSVDKDAIEKMLNKE